jgi:hypothetical protein
MDNLGSLCNLLRLALPRLWEQMYCEALSKVLCEILHAILS